MDYNYLIPEEKLKRLDDLANKIGRQEIVLTCLLDLSPLPSLSTDLDGNVLYANVAAKNILPEDCMNIYELLSSDLVLKVYNLAKSKESDVILISSFKFRVVPDLEHHCINWVGVTSV